MKEKKGFFAMFKLGLIFAVYAAIACVGLAFIYDLTKEIIAEHQQQELEEALLDLFPEADEFEPISGIIISDSTVTIEADKYNPVNTGAFAVWKDGSIIGVALRTSRGGYSGAIKLLVGTGAGGNITGVRVLEHKETPGLGSNAVKPAFYRQFDDKPVTDRFAAKQDVAAITAATITTAAISASVKAAGEASIEWIRRASEGQDEE